MQYAARQKNIEADPLVTALREFSQRSKHGVLLLGIQSIHIVHLSFKKKIAASIAAGNRSGPSIVKAPVQGSGYRSADESASA
jgi:hypothetical protein